MDVYVDGNHTGYWQDPTPLTVGNAVSFRSGNATLEVDNITVYRNRLATETVTAGTATSMLRYQNPDPLTPAGCIRSAVVDDMYLLGFDTLYKDVDFTSPVHSAIPTEELTDVDTILNLSSFLAYANVYTDQHSGVDDVYYGMGTTTTSDDVVPFNILPPGDSVMVSTTGLVNGQYYYFTLFAVNHAGLVSDTIASDGFLFINTAGIEENGEEVSIYPNPASGFIMISLNVPVNMALTDIHGQVIMNRMLNKGTNVVSVEELASGYYFLSLGDKTYKICVAR